MPSMVKTNLLYRIAKFCIYKMSVINSIFMINYFCIYISQMAWRENVEGNEERRRGEEGARKGKIRGGKY